MPKRHRPIQRMIHVWRKPDSRLIHDELATFADEKQKDHNLDTPVETLWALFVARCKQVLAKHVPTKLFSRRFNQPWANGKIRNLSRKKKKYFKKAQRAHDQTKYRETKKLAQSECRKAYYEYIIYMLDANNQNEVNLKKFWSFIKSKKKENSGVAPLLKNGTVHSNSQAKADILNYAVFISRHQWKREQRSESGSEPIQRTTAYHSICRRSENTTGRHQTTQGHMTRRDPS